MAKPFEIVAAAKDDELEANTVDIQLVSDAIAEDELFTVEQSVPAGEGKKRWCSLEDRRPDEIVRVRTFVRRLMELTTPEGAHWVCFAEGVRIVDEPKSADEIGRPDAYMVVEGHDELLELGGRAAIFEVTKDSLAHYERLIGRFDAVHALATSSSFRQVLDALSISAPIPTTAHSRFTREPNLPALRRLLALGDPFVEEVMNGTRLRVVTRRITDLTRLVEAASS